MFKGDRPSCPRRCEGRVHRHGHYERFAKPSGSEKFPVQLYWCPKCGLTISVPPENCLPYRPVEGARMEAFFNEQAEAGTGPDPPPAQLEAGCLRRAWNRFQARVVKLKKAFGLLIANSANSAGALWKQMRLAKGSLESILLYLAQSHKCSMLGDYKCLALPD